MANIIFVLKLINYKNFDEEIINNIKDFILTKTDLEYYYPKIEQWFDEKVVPDIINRRREIFVIMKDKEIVGVSIIRHSISSYKNKAAKICTFYIEEKYRSLGLGNELMTSTINRIKEISGNIDIILTVPEEKIEV